jgi:hypothetical protein
MKIHLSETEFLKAELKRLQDDMQALVAPVQEPIGYLFQHEETGLTTVVDVQQVEWGFEKNNPRHQKIGPVYTTPPAAQRPWLDLTDEQIKAIDEMALTKNMAIAMTLRTLKEVNT